MCDQDKKDEGYFSPEAIALRRKDDTPEIAEQWRAAAVKNMGTHIDPHNWDGKKTKK